MDKGANSIGVYGESLIDLVNTDAMLYQALPGGSPYNVARALGLQRLPVSYLSPLSQDKMGERLRAGLAEAKVSTAAPPSSKPSSLAMVSRDSQGQPSYSLYRDNIADRDISLDTLVSILPEKLSILHTGSLALIPDEIEQSIALIEHLRTRPQPPLICIDLNLRPLVVNDNKAYARAIAAVLPHADLIKLSDEDLTPLPFGETPAEAATTIGAQMTQAAVIITLGSQGCLARIGQHSLQQPVPVPIEVADTVGAGDCFQAGLIAWLYRHKVRDSTALALLEETQWRQCLRFASLTAAYNATQTGCSPPTPEQVEELAKRASQKT